VLASLLERGIYVTILGAVLWIRQRLDTVQYGRIGALTEDL
jgi:hypothetical protein